MQVSFYLSRLLGPVLVAVGLGMALNPRGYLSIARDILAEPALLYLASVCGLIAGLALVLAHNIWAPDWRIIITLLGWISIVDSASWILLTRTMQQVWSPLVASPSWPLVGGCIVALLGAVLCYFGYWASGRIGRRA